jgi:preprotein translocase subunit SecE
MANKAKKTGLIAYIKQVRSEGRKITWPSRQETTMSMVAVFIMVFISAIFLFFADQGIAFVIRKIMGI